MRRLLPSLVALPLLVACGAVPASAPVVTQTVTAAPEDPSSSLTDDQAFLELVGNTFGSTAASEIVEAGRLICRALDSGATLPEIWAAADAANFTSNQAATLIAAAVVIYCPWNESKVTA